MFYVDNKTMYITIVFWDNAIAYSVFFHEILFY